MRTSRQIIVLLAAAAGLFSSARAEEVLTLLLEAQARYEESNLEQALKLYKQANEAAADASVEYNVGLCHLRLGDADNAIKHFEGVASNAEAKPALRRDAFFNVGVIRTTAARTRLEALQAPATQPSEQKPPADSPQNIEKLQAIADELLRAIAAFKESRSIEPGDDVEHDIRAARVTRRDVLGLLQSAVEAKEKKDMLDDPRAYLEELTLEQNRQVSISRYVLVNPPEDPAQARQTRRAALRLQRKTMEQTASFADRLAQFREKAENPAAATTTQPAEETPREKLYRAVAKLLGSAVQGQRDTCAFFLDGAVEQAYPQQKKALEAMRTAAAAFPIEPGRVLARWGLEQAQLTELVSKIESAEQWLQDPLLGEAHLPPEAKWDSTDTAIYDLQQQIGSGLDRLARQARAIAATASQPSPGAEAQPPQDNPALDPQLNAKLADVLERASDPQNKGLAAIADKNKPSTLAAQRKITEIIDEALSLLPKTIEQRIAELVTRQSRLNEEVKAQVGEAEPAQKQTTGESLTGKLRSLTAKLKSALFKSKPADVARQIGEQQRDIRQGTAAVTKEVKEQIPSGESAGTPAPAPSTQQPQVQAYIEAGKHLDKAEFEMLAAIEGLDQAVVAQTLKPMKKEGPVQTAQAAALEELIKALSALRPPENQPQQNDQNKQDQDEQQQDRQQQEDQDARRAVDLTDKQREEAERQLYQRNTRTDIKDW